MYANAFKKVNNKIYANKLFTSYGKINKAFANDVFHCLLTTMYSI